MENKDIIQLKLESLNLIINNSWKEYNYQNIITLFSSLLNNLNNLNLININNINFKETLNFLELDISQIEYIYITKYKIDISYINNLNNKKILFLPYFFIETDKDSEEDFWKPFILEIISLLLPKLKILIFQNKTFFYSKLLYFPNQIMKYSINKFNPIFINSLVEVIDLIFNLKTEFIKK